jgi:hypothetical protein
MTIPWTEVATGLAAGLALGWRVYDKAKEKRIMKQYGLEENPTRCREHDLAIVGLQKDIESIKEDVREIKVQLGSINTRGN